MKDRKIIRHLPNMLSLLNMLLGIWAVMFLVFGQSEQKTRIVSVLIICGAVIDALDGRLARGLGLCTEMGKQLDSFADFVTFGLAPVALISATPVFYNSMAALTILYVFPLAAAYRLARYNIGEYSEYFAGLPTTAAGLITAAYMLILDISGARYGTGFFIATLVIVCLLAVLMVCRLKVRRLGTKKRAGAKQLARQSGRCPSGKDGGADGN